MAAFVHKIKFMSFLDEDVKELLKTAKNLDIDIAVDIIDKNYLGKNKTEHCDAIVFYGVNDTKNIKCESIYNTFIKINTIDFLKTDLQTKNYKKAILILSDYDYADCDVISKYWGIKTESFNICQCESEIERFFDLAEKDTVYIGRNKFCKIFKDKGLIYKTVKLSTETLYKTIKSVNDVISAKKAEEEKNKENVLRLEQYKVVFNFTNDAILAIDENGIIIAANDMVYKFLKISTKERLEGKHIYNVVKGTKMLKAMQKDGGDIGDIFDLPYGTVLTHRIPIEIDGKKRGVVSTFQDLAVLQEHEKNARLSLSQNKKGFFAKYGFDDIKGTSKAITETKNVAKSYAFSNSTVLILGETGTGKELFAQSIHNAGLRKDGPFVAVNCAAIAKNLLEAEFFGYDEGSFTGASKGGKMGVFEMAHMGTIFLDEIGEMPLEMQVQLLRAIQEKEIRRIGSDRVIPVDVRVIAATNRDLYKEVLNGNFREDLYYRLDVLELKIPPLRQRKEDIEEIAISFIKNADYKCFKSNEALWLEIVEELTKYDFRGNIRELQNIIERISVMMKNSRINVSALFSEINKIFNKTDTKKRDYTIKYEYTDDITNEQWEKNRIISALKNNALSRTKTAEELGISRATLWNKIKKYKIDL